MRGKDWNAITEATWACLSPERDNGDNRTLIGHVSLSLVRDSRRWSDQRKMNAGTLARCRQGEGKHARARDRMDPSACQA